MEKMPSLSAVSKIIIFVLLLFALASSLLGNRMPLTFGGLLEVLSNAPTVPSDVFSKMSGSNWGSWTIQVYKFYIDFNFLRDFLSSALSPLLLLGTGIVQIYMYVFYFISFLFGV